jgi:hypothetical protein
MSNSILKQIKRGNNNLPPRIVVAGPEGIGKSTLASKAPGVLFICPEDGLTGLEHVSRLSPNQFGNSIDGLHQLLDELIASPGEIKHVAIDTSDWLERFIGAAMCKRDGKSSIEDYGYGKGYVLLEEEIVKLLQKLDALRAKNIGIIILSHVNIRTFTDPAGPTYDRYEMKGHKRITGLLREWPDALLFATRQVFTKKEKGTSKETAIGGDRIMHTEWSVAWDAKNRLNLPSELPLEWDALVSAIAENTPANLIKRATALYATATIDPEQKAKWEKAVAALSAQSADRIKAAIAKLESMQPQK